MPAKENLYHAAIIHYKSLMRVALYQPDIPQNAGAAMRLCACLGLTLDIIEPCGFLWNERKIRRAGMDYADMTDITRHKSWDAFRSRSAGSRIVLMTTKGAVPYCDFSFAPDDIILAGRESAGVPEDVHQSADERIVIPMHEGARSLNVVNALAMVAGEALRQVHGFPRI
jgi:tRNA (cytidine/uridine-2'-O-)-methyltransferase